MRKDYFSIKSSRNNLNGKHLTSVLFFVLLFVFTSQNIFAQGDIFTAATPATNPMDPNGDGFITTTGGLFTGAPTLEESEFEITYIELPNFGTEPDGDLQTGANCGATEIVENTANSSNGSYYYISDPDGIPDNGDELMLFRMRIAQNPSGAFGYSFLVDTDNLFGFAGATADPNAIAGNPGFEIEVVLGIQGGGAGVNVFNVDGTTSGASINSYPLSSNYQRVNALDNDPDCGPGAIFFDFYVPLTDVVPSVVSSFRLVAASSSSASSALGGSASDISGVDGLLIPADDDQFEAAISAYGAAAAPEIDVLGNAISIIGDGTNTPNVADGTDFGQVFAGTSSVEHIFTIENTGTSDLTLNPSFSSNPAFSITTPAASLVAAGGSTTIGITFNAPLSVGVVTAQLFISNNDADEGPAYQINLSGESIAPAPEIDLLGNGISIIGNGTNTPNLADNTNFGQVLASTNSTEHFFTIQNIGTSALSVNPAFMSNPAFAITSGASTPVAAGGSTTIGITFTAPATLGISNATLFLTNSDSDENPYQINLQAESVAFIIKDADGDGISDADECFPTANANWQNDGINVYTIGGLTDGSGSVASNWDADVVTNGGTVTSVTDWAGSTPFSGPGYTISHNIDVVNPISVVATGSPVWQSGAGGTGMVLESPDPDFAPSPFIITTTINFISPVNAAGFDMVDLFDYEGTYATNVEIDVDGITVWESPPSNGVGNNLTGLLDFNDGQGNLQGQMLFGHNIENFVGFISPLDFSTITIRFIAGPVIAPVADREFHAFDNLRFATFIFCDDDGDGIANVLDLDSDNDGISDAIETNVDTDGDSIPDFMDLDSDGDGIFDVDEAGHTALDGDDDGIIDGLPIDFGANGLFDSLETAPESGVLNYTVLDTDTDGLIDSQDEDDDGDGVNTTFENPDPNGNMDPADAQDSDLDGTPDYLDTDDDGDGVNTIFEVDNADLDGDPTTGVVIDTDSDTTLDYLDTDDDGDGVNTIFEVDNADLDGDPTTGVVIDTDSDTTLDYLDTDDDGDGVNTEFEVDNADLDGDPTTGVVIDTDSDTTLDYLDADDDGDSVNTIFEVDNADLDGDPTTGVVIDTDSDTTLDYLDTDDDGDGVNTIFEVDNTDMDGDPTTGVVIDTDSDTALDYLDTDDDGDGVNTIFEVDNTDLDGDPTTGVVIDTDSDTTLDYLDTDDDGDGVNTIFEVDNADLDGDPTTGVVIDTDSDTTLDYLDTDDDGDGVNTEFEVDNADLDGDPTTGVVIDTDSDTTLDYLDTDDDGDGVNTIFEVDNTDLDGDPTTGVVIDTDSDTTLDYLDTDDDGDGVNTIFEVDNTDMDGDPTTGVVIDTDSDTALDYLDTDDDGDGVNTIFEVDNTDLDGDPTTGVVIDTDSDTTLDYLDTDDDGDGVNTEFEVDNSDLDGDPTTGVVIDTDSDTTLDYLDADDDGDGVNTIFEVDNADLDGDPTTGVVIDTDSDTTLDYLDTDDDGDGVNTIFEVDNTDLDGDPTTGVVIDTDSDTTLDYLDTDDDGDGVNTVFEVDNTDLDGDPTTGVVIDTDSDTTLDYLDVDDDGDNINTEFEVDNADADGDPTTGVVIDSDGDTILNYLDPDDDGDGIDTINENPDPNGDGDPIDAEDKDGDGIPNYLDLDSDNDGILDSVELAIDTDGDGVENYVDLDSDNDGIFDVVEAGLDAFDSNLDGVIDTLISVGVNGLFDALETFPDSGILNPIYDPIDSTTAAGVPAPDGIFDFLELDSDTDGCNDVAEAGYSDGDSDGLLGTSPVATDTNGLVTSAIDGYTIPNDTDVNGTFDFQEYSETTNISTQPVTPPPTIAGGTVNIDITSNANTFQWEVSTTGIGGPYTPIANDANYGGVTTANLTISNIPLSFDGNFYRVQLSTNNFLCDIPLISDAVEVTVQQDNDGDGIPDITDLDDDNDGIPDVDEDAGGVPVDVDGDGVPNSLDLDSDNDGIYDLVESGQIDAANNVVDVNNDGIIDAANAGTVGVNGIFDPLENAPDSGVLINATADSDTDGIVDSNEINADDDGCNDVIEAGFTDPDANGFLGNGTPGVGLVTDANGVVTGQGGYTTPDDNDSNGTYDFQEPGEQVVLSSQPLSQVVVINATANFDVTGTSPVYTWYESTDGGIIWNVMTNGGTNPTVTGANTDTLTLTNVPGSYDGNQYRVVLSSPAFACGGNITSNSALLTVYADFDGDGVGDPVDLDDDNDGIPDTVESGGVDPTSDNDGDGVPVYLDDNDNNIAVGNDNGMVEPAFDFDGDGLANHLELDSDNDGVYDTNEAGFADLDLDNNGVVDGIPADFGANGLLDSLETAPESGLINYTPLDTDSDTRLNFIDRDDDADGVNTQYENPDADSNGDPSDAQDTDSDGTPDYLDIDDDADGVYTSFEGVNPDGDGNPNTGSTRDTDSDTVFNYLDIDDDNDGVYTVFEGVNPDGDGNPNTGATLNTDGDSLLNYLDTDDDGDSILTEFENPDANNDGDPSDAQDTDGDLIPDYLDNDDDDDTILTFFENPDPDGNGDPLDAQDSDGNGVPDYLDNDDDGDGVLTELENPDPNGNGNPSDAQDTDGDGIPDYLDVDDDGDGILTLDEDVDGDGDPTNDDSDADGVPNYLDIDDDNDGIITLTEGPGNVDSDSYPNYLDQDADGDGIPDNVEGQLTLGYVLPAGDSDGNGLDDAYEATPGAGGGIVPVNTDGADNPDYLDSDSDNDNVPDSIEGHNFLAQFDPDVLPSGNDVDGDGLDDAYDGAVGSFLDPNGLIVIDNPATDLPNFDSTDEVNYRDTDDDNDGINTIDEDGDLSGDPIYDDCDEDGNPDYVDIIPCDRIPTGFSPNDDGNNDTLVVPALAQYKDFTMEVYDRWGNIVYEYNNNGREQPLWWDGFSSGTRTINKGEKVPVGTYFYVIEFNQDRIPPRTGWVYVNY